VTELNNARNLGLLTGNEERVPGGHEHSDIIYHEIFNNVASPIWVCDPRTLRILDVNNDVKETLGYTVEEALALKISDISSGIPPYTGEALDELLLSAAAGEPQSSEWLFRHKDGRLIWTGLNIRSATISTGRCTIVLMRNITHRKNIEEELKKSEERYRRLFDVELDAILLLETNTQRILDSNLAASLLYGYTKEEFLEMTTPDISAEPEKTREATINRTTRIPLRYHRKKDGDVFPVEIVATHLELGDSTEDLCIAAIRDITERQRAEDVLMRSRLYLSRIIEFLPDATFVVNAMGNIVIWNRAMEELTGNPAGDVVERGSYRHLLRPYTDGRPILLGFFIEKDPASLDVLKEHYRDVINEGDAIFAVMCRNIPGSGKKVLWAKASPLRDDLGNVIGAIETLRDVTKQKENEQTLRLQALVLDQITDHVTITDLNGRVTYINRAEAESVGRNKRGQLSNLYRKGLYHAGAPGGIIDATLRHGSWRGKVTAYTDTDHRYTMDCRSQVIYDEFGNPVALCGIATDITERERAEKAVRESEARFKEIFETMEDLYYQLDQNGTIVLASPSARRLTGWSNDELRGQQASTFYVNPEEREELLSVIMKKGYVHDHEVSLVRRDGQVRIASLSARLITDENGRFTGMRGVLRDITGRKAAEKALIESGGFICVVRDMTTARAMFAAIKEHERDLEIKSSELEEMNTALTVLLKQREKDRKELEERFVANVREKILPYVARVRKGQLSPEQRVFLESVEANLNEITSPFLHTMKQYNFTPKEIEVASLIKEGKATKEFVSYRRHLNTGKLTVIWPYYVSYVILLTLQYNLPVIRIYMGTKTRREQPWGSTLTHQCNQRIRQETPGR